MNKVDKSQAVRLVDVFLIAPYLIYLGTNKKLSPLNRTLLIGLGVATAVYNGRNYLINERR